MYVQLFKELPSCFLNGYTILSSHEYCMRAILSLHLHQHLVLVQFNSVAQSYPTLCDPMNRSTPGLPVHHQLPEFTQTHVH